MAEIPDKSRQQQVILDDDDEIISLSDAELDTILGSAEITDAPIADIEIDIISGPASRPAPAEAGRGQTGDDTPQPEAGGGFFSSDDDETISLPEDELETILDTGTYEADGMEPSLPESEVVVAGSEQVIPDMLETPSLGGEPDVEPDFGGPETPIDEGVDDAFIIIDDQPLESSGLGMDSGPMIIEEEISPDTAMPELDFAREQAARSNDEPVVEVTGDSMDDLFDDDAEVPVDGAGEDVLDDFEVEDHGAEINLSPPQPVPVADIPGIDALADEPSPLEIQPAPPEFFLEEGAAEYDSESVDDLLIEEAPILDQQPVERNELRDTIIDVEDELIDLEPIERREDLEDSSRSEVVFDDEAEGDTVVSLPVGDGAAEAGYEAGLEEETVLETGSFVAEDGIPPPELPGEEPVIGEPPRAEVAKDDGFVRAPDFEEEIASLSLEEAPAGTVPVVDQVDLADEPIEFMEDEIVFAPHQTIPAAEPVSDIAPDDDLLDEEIINPDMISEMKDEVFDEPDSPDDEPVASDEVRPPSQEVVEGMPERMRDDVRKVLGYLDNLFDELPEDKVKEFANSEYYDIYSRLFKELGI
ncbi:MAG TPA: hypothetical protein PLD82_00775 [Spirochaetota bacterium]|nr:hypothetical protein [Spirochaetota bacterium]HPH02368.1 hypothetical protein [Spirochaetota bacterium]